MIYNPQTLWPYTRLKRRWLHVFDCLGRLLGVGAILPRLPHAEQQPFSALLLSMAFIAWLLRAREPRTFRLERSAFEQLEVPLAAALLTLIVSALLRSYYSGTALVMFILVWSSWLIAGRLAFKYFTPPVRVLIIGTPNLATELRSLEGLQLTTTTTPPGTFDSWDVALIDSTRVYSEAWLQWLTRADIAGVP